MHQQWWATTLQTTLTAAVMLVLGYYANKRGWIFNRRTEEIKLEADRCKTLELENAALRTHMQELREQVIGLMIKDIGRVEELGPKMHMLLTASIEDIVRLEEARRAATPDHHRGG